MDSKAHKKAFSWINTKSDKLFKCDLCNLNFYSQQDISDHVINRHNSNIDYACSFCFESFIASDLLVKHMRAQHIALSYLCSRCESEFLSKSELLQHATKHTMDNSSLLTIVNAIERRCLTCGVCPQFFSQSSLLRLHVESHHVGPHCREEGSKIHSQNPCCGNACVKHSCNFCARRNEDEGHARNEEFQEILINDGENNLNKENDKNSKSTICLKRCLKSNSDPHDLQVIPLNSSQANKHYLCIFCLKQFSNKQMLEIHERIHSADISSVDTLVATSVKGNTSPSRHQKIWRNRIKFSQLNEKAKSPNPAFETIQDISIPFCKSKSFVAVKKEVDSFGGNDEDLSLYVHSRVGEFLEPGEAEDLASVEDDISHLYKIHHRRRKVPGDDFVPKFERRKKNIDMKGVPSYVCHHCLKGFRSKIKFLDHYSEHDKSVKLFSCLACDARFGYSSSMPKHMEMHMRDLGVLSPKKTLNLCPKCGKYYRDRASLKRHEAMVHLKVGHPCLECNRKFSSIQALKQHTRQHAGEYIYECNLCNKKYANPSSLHNHKKTHSENKLTCNLCARVFSLKHHLTRHLARHIGFSTRAVR